MTVESTTKTRYVIQFRRQFAGCTQGAHKSYHKNCEPQLHWSEWRDGAGIKADGTPHKYIFDGQALELAKKSLQSARRRKSEFSVVEYRLVEQISTWNVLD